MPQHRWLRLIGRKLFVPASAALASSCGGGDGGGLTAPTTGAIEVTTSTTGTDVDPDGYTLTLDDVAVRAIGTEAAAMLDELEPGTHRVALAGVAPNCQVQGSNPRALAVVAGETRAETFAVVCAEPPPETGGLSVTTVTTGDSPDPDGYTVTVDGGQPRSIGTAASVAVPDLGAGNHQVGLGGVAANCAVAGDNPRTVAVAAGTVVPVTFTVECDAPPPVSGTLVVVTATGGTGADPDGYAFSIGGGPAQPIGADASVSVAGVAAGPVTVELTGLAANCDLAGRNPREVTVPAGGSAEVSFSITCAAGTGTLVVTTVSSGSPADPSGYTVTVDGPPPADIGVNASRTFQGLEPGVHTVSLGGVAGNCALQGQNPRSVTIAASQTATVTFTVQCTATTGSLTVTIAGLPGGSDADVAVTGPGNFSRTVTETTTLEGLTPGEYEVDAEPVSAGGSTYTATPPRRSVAVAAGATATITVTYAAGPAATLNLWIAGLHLTQSVQTFDNEIPLVAGRDALLRVTALANLSNTATPAVRVRLYQGNTLLETYTIGAPADTVPTGRSDGVLTTTWNVRVPASLVRSRLEVVADVDPAGAVAEADESDNTFPRNGRLTVAVRDVAPLAITLVPVRQSVNQLQGDVTPGNADDYLDLTERMMPIPGYQVSVRPQVYTTSAPALQHDDANGAWIQILSEIANLQMLDDPDRYYYGVVRLGYASGQAGLGFLGSPAAIGYDVPGDRSRITAHELGHNWGRLHAPCGSPAGGTDRDFPYPSGSIGRIGFDPARGVLLPRETPDVMGYCGNPWISDYTYQGVMNFRGSARLGSSVAASRPSLLVWGRIVDGRAVLEPAFHVVTRPVLPTRSGPYALEGAAADGTRVFGLTFETVEVADHPRGGRHFAFAVPLDASAAARLESIRLTGPGIAAALSRPPAALRAAPAEPVSMVPAAGGVALRWDAAAHPMVMVRDARTGAVLSFARGGSLTLPDAGGGMELLVSDGVQSRSVPAAR
ncbi:MAG TPA: hypothetical protein VHG35_13020 [Gemmatimonadales bacterium]|nr:hypothetical protein [Gemmatimonadales bacterium]